MEIPIPMLFFYSIFYISEFSYNLQNNKNKKWKKITGILETNESIRRKNRLHDFWLDNYLFTNVAKNEIWYENFVYFPMESKSNKLTIVKNIDLT